VSENLWYGGRNKRSCRGRFRAKVIEQTSSISFRNGWMRRNARERHPHRNHRRGGLI